MYKPKLYLNKKNLQGKKEKKNEKEEEKREEKKENKGRKKRTLSQFSFSNLELFFVLLLFFLL